MSADDKEELTNEVKASVMNSGALTNLKQVSQEVKIHENKRNLDDLKQQAEAVVENIEQLLYSRTLDDSTSLKLTAVLAKLRSALEKGTVSRTELAAILSEAVTALDSATDRGANLQQKAEQVWLKIAADNKDIDDDFVKMQKAGVVFNQSLLDRHKEIMEYLRAHPRDIAKQKELDAVDDAMLMQVESQIAKNPDAEPSFDDARRKVKTGMNWLIRIWLASISAPH